MAKYLVFSAAGCIAAFVFFSSGFECSDLQGYLSMSGFSQLDIFRIDGLLYYLLYIIGNSKIWYSLIQVLTISIWWSAAFCASARASTLFQLQVFPWFFSIIGVHYWLCGIRAGLSGSLLFLCLALRIRYELSFGGSCVFSTKRSTMVSIALFLLLFLSFLTHWSSALVAPLVVWPDYIAKSIRTLPKLFRGSLARSLPVTVAFLIFSAVIFFLLFSSRAFFYLESGDVFSNSLGEAAGDGYGRFYGYVSLSLLVVCAIYRRSLIIGSDLLLGLFLFSSFACLFPFFGFSGLFIRFQIPLVSAFFYSFIALAPVRPLLLFLISAPYAAFTLKSLFFSP